MNGQRYVVLGLARARSPWFTEVARWATAATLPIQYVKCVSVEEVRARLTSGRAFSALLVDDQLGVLDRDLVTLARAHGCGVIAVADPSRAIDAEDLGLASRLRPDFDRSELLDALASHALLVSDAVASAAALGADPEDDGGAPWLAPLVAVCGPGGTGASTVAALLAQGFATDPRLGGLVVLADLALHADQGVLHGSPDVVPGLPELIDAHRRGRPAPVDVRRLTYAVPHRGYQLLLGLRRHRDWAALRPRALEAALVGLRQSFRAVVVDVDADVEGEAQCGAADLDDRNLLARVTLAEADAVVVVGGPGLKGLHALVRTVGLLIEHGVEPSAMLPVLNRAPRRASRRAEVTQAFAELLTGATDADRFAARHLASPLFLADRGAVDDWHRDGLRLPSTLAVPCTRAVQAVLSRRAPAERHDGHQPQPVVPGSIGTWSELGVAEA